MDPFSSSAIARQTWELENNIVETASASGDPSSAASASASASSSSAASDAIFYYDEAAQAKFQQEKPWTNDPHYFKRVRISALALLKMVVHARSGGTIEVMGLMQGKTDGDAIIVMDAFALPVEGTETRVNAQADAYEYMVDYSQTNKQAGRLENVVGWYHSHPGYGCWLSGIDVSTQMLNQQFQEPFLAVVIDPTRTVSAGKVDIGAFRTYPEGYKPPDEPVSEYQTIPLNKIEDFGVHCKQYYALDITYFKSSLDCHLLDLLWNKYWVNTLSSSPLLGNGDYVAGQISDLAEKIEQAENQLSHSRFGSLIATPQRKKEVKSFSRHKSFLLVLSLGYIVTFYIFYLFQEESQLSKITRDSAKITVEQVHGLMSQVIKDILFNSVRQSNKSLVESSGPEPMIET
ncbi:COP9 signalosome complex subunit 5a [Striga hermonthica]|uniref:COP9 signalosome complex subunit 5a n=1 Tax=Striga hermonthica TaxID=68872 RepID=A0A9N7N2S0_STRHE|nr:COP9 signalosome complex subunit 5a [Striga hermonthica]